MRVFVWRTLRRLGAVYIQQSVCLLPDRAALVKAVARMAAKVRGQGGEAQIVRITVREPADHQGLVRRQQADRDVEYAEVVERVPQFLAEIEVETARGRATYAEVEESEADLDRFRRWLAGIAARDYFNAPGGAAARDAVARCAAALETFEAAAVRADTATGEAPAGLPAPRRHLRAVDSETEI